MKNNELVIPGLDKLAKEAVEKAIVNHLSSSAAIRTALDTALKSCVDDIAPQLKTALQKAANAACDNPEFLNDLVRTSILRSGDKLAGAFDASMRAAGKALALDRETLTALADEVKHRILTDREEKGVGMFS